jgi:hypothetical protein
MKKPLKCLVSSFILSYTLHFRLIFFAMKLKIGVPKEVAVKERRV